MSARPPPPRKRAAPPEDTPHHRHAAAPSAALAVTRPRDTIKLAPPRAARCGAARARVRPGQAVRPWPAGVLDWQAASRPRRRRQPPSGRHQPSGNATPGRAGRGRAGAALGTWPWPPRHSLRATTPRTWVSGSDRRQLDSDHSRRPQQRGGRLRCQAGPSSPRDPTATTAAVRFLGAGPRALHHLLSSQRHVGR